MAITSNLAGVARVAFEASTGEFNRDVSVAESRYKTATQGMSDSSIRLELAQERLRRALAKGPAAYQSIARAELAVRRETAALNSELQRHGKRLDENERAIGRFSRGALAGSGAARGLGRSVAFASGTFLGGAGLAYALTSTLKVAGDFQRSLNILKVVTGATAAQMETARAKAVELGRDVTLPATSAKDAANAMTTLAKAGLDMQNAIAGSEGVLRLAAAAQIDVATAGGIAAKSIVSFGLAATDTGRVADVFANAANASVGEISDFSLALAQSSQVAKSWGLSIEDTVTILANFAQAGIQGSDAGTSLRVMLSRLVPTSVNAQKAFEKLHISAFDANGQIKPFRQNLTQLHDAFKNLTPEQQKLNVQMIFGQDAQRGAGIAILNTIKNYDTMRAKIGQVGTAQKFAAGINQGYVGSLDAFRSAVETLQISIGTKLLPGMTSALKAATNFVNGMEESGTAAHEAATAAHDLAIAAKILAGGIKSVYDAVAPAVKAVGGLTRALEIALGVMAVKKLAAVVRGFELTAIASGATKTKVVADAAEIEAALDVATRPRNVIITTEMVGGGTILGPNGKPIPGAAPATRGGKWAGRARTVGKGAALLTGPEGLLAIGAVLTYNAVSGSANQASGGYGEPVARTRDGRLLYSKGGQLYVAGAGQGASGPGRTVRGGSGRPITLYRFTPPVSAGLTSRPDEGTRANPDANTKGPAPTPTARGGSGGGQRGDGLSRLQRLQLAIGDAETKTPKDQSDDLRANRALEAYYASIVKNGKLHGDDLYKARQDLQNQQQRVQSIEDGIASDRQQAADNAAAKRKAAAEKLAATKRKHEAAAKKLAAATYKVDANISNVLRKLYDKSAMVANSDGSWSQRHPTKDKKTADEVSFAKLSFAFLEQLQGVTNQYSPNVTVNQHFATPTPDQHRETLYARRAVESSYQTHGF